MSDLPEEILKARVVFWSCIVPEHKTVDWYDGVAHCSEHGCAVTSEHTSRLIDIVREMLTAPIGHEVRPWVPEDGDKRCQDCGMPNVVWFTSSELWNRVMPQDGVVCIPCFIRKAEVLGIDKSAWFVGPEVA